MKRFEIILCLTLAGAALSQPVDFDNPWAFDGKPTEYAGILMSEEDSLNVRFIGNWPFGPSYAIAYDEERRLVFLGSGGGVYIYDVTDIDKPVLISDTIRTQGIVYDLCYEKSWKQLYVAATWGFQIWDISKKTSPMKLSDCYSKGARGIHVSFPYAYVIGWDTLRVFDISNSSEIQEMGSIYIRAGAKSIDGSGSHICVAGGQGFINAYFQVIDVTNPTEPLKVGYYPIPDQVEHLCVSDSFAYIVGVNYPNDTLEDGFLRIIDISNPSDPFEVGRLNTSNINHGDVHISNSFVYVAGTGLSIIDVSVPSEPKGIGSIDIKGSSSSSVSVSWPYAFVSCYNGFRVINVFSQTEPFEVNSVDGIPGWANSVFISESYAYIAEPWRERVSIIDVSDPRFPNEVGFCLLSDWAYDVWVRKPFAYVACGGRDSGSLYVLDISIPSKPMIRGICRTPGPLMAIHVTDNYAYVADGDPGLRIIDISRASRPREIGFYEMPIGPSSVYVQEEYAYLTSWDSGLYVIDISEPSNPQEVGRYEHFGCASDIKVLGPYAYVTEWRGGGIHIFDVSDPCSPKLIGFCDTQGTSNGIYVSYPYVYLADWERLNVVDISVPSNPREVGYYYMPCESMDVFVLDSYIYVADICAGLQIYEQYNVSVEEGPVIPESTIKLSGCYGSLSYDLPGEARLVVYSADGRKALEEILKGRGTWAAPQALPQGVYFAKLATENCTAEAKLIVLR
ncbi:hypothetical protein JXM67_00200 [candidate division WOR-3 bacterium]|nr:hypothetical protein [candidate division WOR-3 bacterium]